MYTSLAVFALSASAAVSPLSKLVHLHPHAQADTRISITLVNKAPMFQDVKVDGHIYTVLSNRALNIKAPAGTVIYADSSTGTHHRGEVIAELDPTLNKKAIELK